jgi:hypothetical protein
MATTGQVTHRVAIAGFGETDFFTGALACVCSLRHIGRDALVAGADNC